MSGVDEIPIQRPVLIEPVPSVQADKPGIVELVAALVAVGLFADAGSQVKLLPAKPGAYLTELDTLPLRLGKSDQFLSMR